MSMKRQKQMERMIVGIVGVALLCLIVVGLVLALPVLVGELHAGGAGVLSLVGFGVLGTVLTDDEFKTKMTGGLTDIGNRIKGIEDKNTDLVAKFDNLDKETKKAFDELTKVKNTANESHENVLKSIQKVEAQLRNERRMAFGNPIQRIQANDELRTRLNLLVRMQCPDSYTRDSVATLTKALTGASGLGAATVMTDELEKEIYDTLQMYGVWNTFKVARVGARTLRLPISTARAVALFIDEAGEISADATKAGTEVSAAIKKAAVLLYVSGELLKDADTDISGLVLEDFAQAMAYRMDWCCLQADGGADTTDGSMTGIFGGGGTAATAAAGNITVESTDMEDWQKCQLTVDAAILQRNAAWWLHPQILVRSLSVKDANKRPLFLTAQEAPTAKGIGSILGYPVIPAAAAPSTNASSAKVAVFGDPNGQVVAVRNDFEFAASEHHRFNFDQIAYRGLARFGTKVRAATAYAVLTLPAA